jgi:LysM repeat protein
MFDIKTFPGRLSQYNRIMARLVLLFAAVALLGAAACTPQASPQTPLFEATLLPYNTPAPTLTPDQPEGVAALETPLPSPTPFLYEIQAGDTLGGIALKYGVSLDDLVAANPDVSPNSMSIGTNLRIPSNPAEPSGASTPTPVPAPVQQVVCYPGSDQGMWCFVLVLNDTPDILENLSAQVTLLDGDGEALASAPAISVLNILPPGTALPLVVAFPPVVPSDAAPLARLLTGIRLASGDERYLPAGIHNTLVQVDGSGRTAWVSGQVRLPPEVRAASTLWIAAVAYDRSGRVVGVKRWQAADVLAPGDSLPFTFIVSSLGGEIDRVEFAVEARP